MPHQRQSHRVPFADDHAQRLVGKDAASAHQHVALCALGVDLEHMRTDANVVQADRPHWSLWVFRRLRGDVVRMPPARPERMPAVVVEVDEQHRIA